MSAQNSGILKGKLAIITGSARGIGKGIAQNLASKGADLLLHFNSTSSKPAAESLAKELSSTYGITAVPFQANLELESEPASIVEFAVRTFEKTHRSERTGELQIDIIVNNAGLGGSMPLPDTDVATFYRLYRVNVLGPLLLVKAAFPYFPHDGSGRIVSLSSVSSSQGFEGQSIYGGTKAALEAMSRTWARELKGRCSVTCVNPGPVDTEMYEENTKEFKEGMKPFIMHTPGMWVGEGEQAGVGERERKQAREEGGRRGKVEEVAGVVGMLCGPESGWCTGSVVCANGGMVMGL